MMDPLTAAVLSLREISDMFDEMWDAHGDSLSIYDFILFDCSVDFSDIFL